MVVSLFFFFLFNFLLFNFFNYWLVTLLSIFSSFLFFFYRKNGPKISTLQQFVMGELFVNLWIVYFCDFGGEYMK